MTCHCSKSEGHRAAYHTTTALQFALSNVSTPEQSRSLIYKQLLHMVSCTKPVTVDRDIVFMKHHNVCYVGVSVRSCYICASHILQQLAKECCGDYIYQYGFTDQYLLY